MIANMHDHVRVSSRGLRQQPREPAKRPLINGNNRFAVVGLILMIALLAFEIFNFDTTQFALTDLLGDVRFAGVRWATILAIAFCGIDFAGLLRIFTPDEPGETPREVWYLMAAWLLGATLNAVMTWYAVSLALVENNIGNQILSQEQLLRSVPVFVAMLVWLTRILFIGAFSVAGNHVLAAAGERPAQRTRVRMRPKPQRPTPLHVPTIVPDVVEEPRPTDYTVPLVDNPDPRPGASAD